MIQEILMWSSVSGAFGYTLYSFVKIVMNTFQEKKLGCSSGCSCGSKSDLLKNIKVNKL